MTATRTSIDHTIGVIHVLEWPGEGQTVIALPGLGSSAWSWNQLAADLPDVRLIAPDLRGRGNSFEVGGPTGVEQHAADVRLIAQELDLHDVVLVGHSMGAYLAPLVAQELGDRATRIVLIDGGVPPKLPFVFRPWSVRMMFKANVKKSLGPWESTEAMVDKLLGKTFAGHRDLRDATVITLDKEMTGSPGALRPRMHADRLSADAVDTFFNPVVRAAFENLKVPAHLIWCDGGRDDNSRPMYTKPVVDEWLSKQPLLTAEFVRANHVTVAMGPEVLRAVDPTTAR